MISWKYTITTFLFFNIFPQKGFCQYALRMIVNAPTPASKMYVAGSFNNWDPADTNYLLTTSGPHDKEIVIQNLKEGKYEFKFTKGNERTFECGTIGNPCRKRTISLSRDTTIYCKVEAWSDAYFDMNGLSDSALYEALEGRAGYYVELDLDSSYRYALRLYKQAQKIGSPLKQARALDLQGFVFTHQGNGEKALELLLKSLALKKSIDDSSGIGFTYNAIGHMYEILQDPVNAINNYKQSLPWSTKAYAFAQSIPLTSIGAIFFARGDNDSARYYATKAINFNGHSVGALLLMGDIQMKNNKSQLALEYYKKAVNAGAFSIPGSPFFISNVEPLKKIGETFYRLGAKDSAFIYERRAFALASNIKNPYHIISAGTALVSLFKAERQVDSAFFYLQIVMQRKDSLFTEAKERQVHNIYFLEKLREQENDALAKSVSSKMKIYGLAGIVAVVLLLGFAFRFRLKANYRKRIAEIEMRALRAQMNPHFIFNCLASINRYIVKSDTRTASGYLTKFSKLIRMILDNSSNEYVSVDTEIQTLKLYLDMELLRFDNSFEYDIQQTDLRRTDNTGIPTMIIQPYIENAIWHGLLQKGEKGKLWVRFFQLSDDNLQVEIEDNGIGRKMAAELGSKDALKTKSYGMQISKDRIRLINTQHDILSSVTVTDLVDTDGAGTGTKIVLRLPLVEIAAIAPQKNRPI
ncbi:MAG: histidine kinase [Chitinophagaceae bacterium]